MVQMASMTITRTELAELLTEWERRRREDPDTFDSGADELTSTPAEYGEEAAEYLFALRDELRSLAGRETR